MATFRALVIAGAVVVTYGLALAKLPAPPPMDDAAKAAAEEKKAKDGKTAEAAKAAQTKAEDRVVSRYIAEQKAKGIEVHPTPIAAPTAAPGGMTPAGNTPPTQTGAGPTPRNEEVNKDKAAQKK